LPLVFEFRLAAWSCFSPQKSVNVDTASLCPACAATDGAEDLNIVEPIIDKANLPHHTRYALPYSDPGVVVVRVDTYNLETNSTDWPIHRVNLCLVIDASSTVSR
jgi:hypothetical protein